MPPTFAQVWNQIKAAIKVSKDIQAQAATIVSDLDSHDTQIKGSFAPDTGSVNASIRNAFNSSFNQPRNMVDQHFQDLAVVINSPQRDPVALMDQTNGDLYQYFIDNSQSLNSRGITFGAIASSQTLASESLNEGDFATTVKWTAAGDFAFAGNAAVYTHSAGSGSITQTAANLAVAGVASKWYKLAYTVSGVSGTIAATITVLFARSAQTLILTAGAQVIYFVSASAPTDFVISATSSSGVFTLDDLSLKQVSGLGGNGSVYRLTTDRNSQVIESTSAGVKEFVCIADNNTGSNFGEETFSIFNQGQYKDDLDWLNHADVATISTKSPENGIGRNMGWERLGGTVNVALTASQSIPDWDLDTGTITNFTFLSTPVFQSSKTEKNGTAYSLKCAGNFKISQTLSDIGASADLFRPHFFLVHYDRATGSCDGNLTITLGTNTKTVALTSQAGWQVLSLDLDQKLWYQNFKASDLQFSIELASRTSGYLILDYGIFDTMDFHEGLWYAIVGGSSYFAYNDSFTFSDTISSDAVIQYWLNRWYRKHLPWNSGGGETITDP